MKTFSLVSCSLLFCMPYAAALSIVPAVNTTNSVPYFDASSEESAAGRVHQQDATPLNVSNEVFYHIMPIAWRHAPVAGAKPDDTASKFRFGTFKGIQAGIPYLKSLNVTAIWLNPIFPSPAYHGYQHGPADVTNPWFGTHEEFAELVSACHASQIKVFLDLVTYGINQESIYFRESINNPASGYSPMLGFLDSGNTKFIGAEYPTWSGAKIGFIHWDLRRTSARRLVYEWSKKWLKPVSQGGAAIDGYRLDHVWLRYEQGPEGLGYHIEPFWKEWRTEVESVKPDVFTVAEQQDWTSFGVELMQSKDGQRIHDATFTKPFEFATREALVEENASKLYSCTAASLSILPKGHTYLAIIGDHDVDRLASAVDSAQHPGRLRAAAAVLMLQPFPPVMYYGDELGMRGIGATFGGDANDIPRREPMKWDAVNADSQVTSNYTAMHEAAHAARSWKDNDGTSVAEQNKDAGSLLNLYRTLSAVRSSTPALRSGTYYPIKTDASGVWCFAKAHNAGSVLVAVNVSAAKLTVTITETDSPFSLPGSLEVEPYGYIVQPLTTAPKNK